MLAFSKHCLIWKSFIKHVCPIVKLRIEDLVSIDMHFHVFIKKPSFLNIKKIDSYESIFSIDFKYEIVV
nr:MAG TPA: hypothetical protein [Caudoviricetes sp.]